MLKEHAAFNARRNDFAQFPRRIHIETVMGCNLRCPMCPVSNTKEFMAGRQFTYMDIDLYRKVIDELTEAGGQHFICLNQLGEPTLHKQIVDLVRYSADRGHDVMMTSNGTRLTEEMSRNLIAAGLTQMVLSIDGADQRTYERIRVGGHYEQVVSNVHRFCEINVQSGRPCDVQIDCIESTLTVDQKESFRRRWQPVARVKFLPLSDWSGQMTLPEELGPPRGLPVVHGPRYPCDLLWTVLTVAANGQLMYCCHDYKLASNLPNVQHMSLREAWRINVAAERRKHVNGEFSSAPCGNCNEWRRRPDFYVDPPLRVRLVKAASRLARGLVAAVQQTPGPWTR